MLSEMLETYTVTMDSLVPDLKKLYAPHLNKVDSIDSWRQTLFNQQLKVKATLEPGFTKLDWTSQTWREFTTKCLKDIHIYKVCLIRR